MSRCRMGHDVEDLGRTTNGHCRACARAYERAYDRDRRELGYTQAMPRVSARPIQQMTTKLEATLAWMAYRGVSLGTADRRVQRLFHAETITMAVADEWAIALGSHLALIYPELYREQVSA